MPSLTPITQSPALRRAAIVLLSIVVAGCGRTPPDPTLVARSQSDTMSGAISSAPVRPTSSPSATDAAPSLIASGSPVDPADLKGTIAFSYDDGIWIADADGGHRRRLTSDGGFDPTLSPDSTQIAYRLLLAADDGEIWVMSSTGVRAHDLVRDPDFSDWGPAWSPNSKLIAFDSNRRVGLAIWLMNADGSGQRIIGNGHGEYPSWSPDGKRIVYAGGTYYDIRVMNADGSGDRALTSTAAYDMGPAWSPDGAWIAYHTQVDSYPNLGESGQGPEMEIHLVRPDGSDDHRITNDQVEDSFPAWSPDGRYLMWSRHGQLVVARPDGSGMIEIGSGNFASWVP